MIKTANLTGSVSRNAGGLYESVRRLVQTLMADGVGVQVMGTWDEFTAVDVGAWQPVPVRAFKSIWPESFGYSPDFSRAVMDYRPDLTHTHGIWRYTSVVTNHYSRATKSPYIISPHGMLDSWALRNSRWKKVIAHALYEGAHVREAACLRALCDAEAQAMRQTGLKNPICVIPNGIDLPVISNAENLKAETLKSDTPHPGPLPITPQRGEGDAPWDGLIETGQKVLLYLGRIHPKKGLVNLLRAWAAFNRKSEIGNRKSEDWLLAIAGWDQGGHEAELKRLCGELQIPWADVRGRKSEIGNRKSEILFLGPQFGDDKAACYRDCDAFILPSFSEGLPMVVLEAWAHGKPVLMTPECNLPEGFAANAAIRIETSAESIASGLHELFRLPASDLRLLGSNGCQLVTRKFIWPKIATEMKSVYEWVLGGGQKPNCIIE